MTRGGVESRDSFLKWKKCCGYGTILVVWKKLMMQEREVLILGEFFERVRDIVKKRGGKNET